MLSTVTYKYDKACLADLDKWIYGKDWPAVYIVYSEDKAYVGETLDAIRRTDEHIRNDRSFDDFTDICFISDNTFNKSVIIDLESFLIKYMSADGSKKLINGNPGMSNHSYFYREMYVEEFKEIWQKLINQGIVKNSIAAIENSELFKYSPYKSLNREQLETTYRILEALSNHNSIDAHNLIKVNGGAGTGKTILAVYLVKLLTDIQNNKDLWTLIDDNEDALRIKKCAENLSDIKRIGFVVPMAELNKTMKKVFEGIDGLSSDMILTAHEVANSGVYDLLIVDEAHRLYKRLGLTGAGSGKNNPSTKFDIINERLMGEKFTGTVDDYTELDWILLNSRRQIIFYDEFQAIRQSDIGQPRFNNICEPHLYRTFELYSQMRCKGGNGYYEYVKRILEQNHLSERDYKKIHNYEVKVFDDVKSLLTEIIKKDEDETIGLSLLTAGPSWTTKKETIIDGKRFKWVDATKKNVIRKQDDSSVWSIHQVQGFDLNYVGVIFGPEITYDVENECIKVLRDRVTDNSAKPADDDAAMTRNIINTYLTLMTRGINGVYVYAVDGNLRHHLKKFLL